MCKCEYHKVFICDDKEFIKLNLSVSIIGNQVNYIITNNGSKAICGDLSICSSIFGSRTNCNTKLFIEESITITVDITNENINKDKTIAFIKISDNDWVISNSVESNFFNSWMYGTQISYASDTVTIGILNSLASKSDAKNVNIFYSYNSLLFNVNNVSFVRGDTEYDIRNDGIYFYYDVLKIGSVKNYQFIFPSLPFNAGLRDTFIITSDTPLENQSEIYVT